MAPQWLKNRLKNLLFIVLGLGGFLAIYFLTFYFFSRQNNNGLMAESPSVPPAVSSSASSEFNLPSEQNAVLNEQPPIIESFIVSPPSDSIAGDSSSSRATSSAAIIFSPGLPTNLSPNISDSSLIFGSFFNTFSSSAGINLEETTLYQDEIATAVFYPPDYDWQQAAPEIISPLESDFDSLKFNDFAGPYYDQRCLAADCLEQKGNELSYNGKTLSLPADIKKSTIAAVSIGSLSKRWLVGFTLKDDQGYKGAVFYFDGRKFTPLTTPAPIRSSYFGLFGFGGEEDDFLIVYGAYKGIAYHIQPGKITDISKFFDIRVMNNGFKAEIIRIAYQDNINWYVFSSTLSRPRFVKLWQNRTAAIVGETIFADFFAAADESAAFKLMTVKADEITFLTKIRSHNPDSWRVFVDRGFKNNNPGALVFNPIAHDGKTSSVTIKKIAADRLDLDAGSAPTVKFLFSADGRQWREIPSEQDSDFITPALKHFFLKITFPAWQDKFYSPFLGAVLFDYYCQK